MSHLSLSSLVGQPDAIVELAVLRADKEDTRRLALIAYKKRADESDPAVVEAVQRRDAAYACITDTLDYLQRCWTGDTTGGTKNPPPAAAKAALDLLVQKVLSCEDELAQVAVFRWMLDNGLEEELMQVPRGVALAVCLTRGLGLATLVLLHRLLEPRDRPRRDPLLGHALEVPREDRQLPGRSEAAHGHGLRRWQVGFEGSYLRLTPKF